MVKVTHDDDAIRSELVIRAPRTKVWWALSTPEGWTGWFSQGVTGEFKKGSQITMDFGEYGTGDATITEMRPEDLIAFAWYPGSGDYEGKTPDHQTSSRFELSDHPEGTLLNFVEEGFSRIPEGRRQHALKDNVGGWNWELSQLVAWVEEDIRQKQFEDES